MKIRIILFLAFLSVLPISAARTEIDTIRVKTSSQCDMCKERIEETLAFERGVKSSELDLDTKIVTVAYKTGRTNPDRIRRAISKAGYDADDVPADAGAYGKLPSCCKKPDDPDRGEHH